ncbi:MAG: carboxypeptidase regulatory-like domain-containing protein [Vicinamibacterales bacterium]
MKRISILIALGAILTFLLVACGGGGAQPTSPPVPTQPSAATPPPAAEGYQGGAVSNGGTIAGTVTYSGAVMAPETVEVDKDQEVCGTSIEVAKVETDASGGLANAVVRITDIQSGKPLDSLGVEFVLDQKECVYVPHVVVVPVGSALTVLNSDGILHNIHTTPFDNAPLNKAQPATQTELMSDLFTVPEFIPVGCDVHKWMNATIVATDNPYVVVTGEDGSFSLDDVPAGTYAVEVWHMELGKQTLTVTVEAGETATADAEFK